MAGKQADEATRLVVGRGEKGRKRWARRKGRLERGKWEVTGSCKTAS
jgi:hypothetical protein